MHELEKLSKRTVDLESVLSTAEELKHVSAAKVGVDRVQLPDAKTYCAITSDDRNRRPICRLRFNDLDRLRAGLINDDQTETIVDIDRASDLCKHADTLRETARRCLSGTRTREGRG